MFELTITTHFAAAHQLRHMKGGCERLHGHNWKVEVGVRGADVGQDGMLLDFQILKQETKRVLADLDHHFLNDLEAFQAREPSSENIARYIYECLSRALNTEKVCVSRVTAWESDSACATYTEPPKA